MVDDRQQLQYVQMYPPSSPDRLLGVIFLTLVGYGALLHLTGESVDSGTFFARLIGSYIGAMVIPACLLLVIRAFTPVAKRPTLTTFIEQIIVAGVVFQVGLYLVL